MSTQVIDPKAVTDEIIALVEKCYFDAERFVLTCYPWGEQGTMLEHHDGPDAWQIDFLRDVSKEVRRNNFNGKDPVLPVCRAVSSGHGIGKGAMTGMLVDWIMSTRPHSQGVVTANTSTQLETKTWAAVSRWTGMCLTGPWFVVNSARMYHRAFPKSWFCTPQTCRVIRREERRLN